MALSGAAMAYRRLGELAPSPVALGAVALALLYTVAYLGHGALPGNSPAHPEGWWGWWDQGQYLASARALAHVDFAPARHWYPLGYAVLGAPFERLMPMHPFFLVDLASLLGCYGGYMALARRLDLGPWIAAGVFLLAVAADRQLFRVWVEPWNTSPVAALLWVGFAVIAAHLAAPAGAAPPWRLAALGAIAAGIVAIRPIDAAVAALCAGGVLLHDLLARRLGWRAIGALVAGAAAVALPYMALHWRIYGLAPSEYMRHSAALGFVFSDLGFKAFVLLEEPRAWFGTGAGLLERVPWIALGVAGCVPVLMAARPAMRWTIGLMVAAMALHSVLYLAFVDLLPTGLWNYQNVHYFKWLLPGLALLALLWLRHAWGGRRRAALAGLFAVLAAMALRIAPVAAGPDNQARLLVFPGAHVGWTDGYFSTATIRDARGAMANIAAMRLVPLPDELRVIALRRDFVGPLAWVPGTVPPGVAFDAAPIRFAAHVTLGWPCALPPWPCRRLVAP